MQRNLFFFLGHKLLRENRISLDVNCFHLQLHEARLSDSFPLIFTYIKRGILEKQIIMPVKQ